jgi:type IV pilus assembly protein PilA
MFCSKCGQQNPDGGIACAYCGVPLATAVQFATPNAVQAETDGKAIASLICGILIFLFGFLAGIPAVILGHMSRSSIKKSMGRLKGEGMALAGLILGYVSIAFLPVILIVAAIAIPNLLRARIAANEASAAASVRTINTAAISYQESNKAYPSDLAQLGQADLIDYTLATGQKYGYNFTYTSSGDTFFVVATPITKGTTGTRSFCSSEDLVVRWTRAPLECTAESDPL